MQRSILNIAINATFAAAAVLAAASVQAAGLPASGEFSAADEAHVPAVAVAAPGGNFLATTVAERASSLRANGEVVSFAAAPAPQALTRQAVREEGRMALRAHKLPAGEASI